MCYFNIMLTLLFNKIKYLSDIKGRIEKGLRG